MTIELPEIKRARVLSGHISPETAYLVDGYPYSFTLRCKIRYWLETTEKGAKKGQTRFVSQTTNPKRVGEPWNKQKNGQYYSLTVIFLDENDHVQWDGISYWVYPDQLERWRLMGIYEQLTPADRAKLNTLEALTRQNSPTTYAEWDEKVSILASLLRIGASIPPLENGVLTHEGRRFYIGDNLGLLTAVAQRLISEGLI